jgi:hypothetical protein
MRAPAGAKAARLLRARQGRSHQRPRDRTYRIAGIPKRILIHGLPYSIEGLMAAMIAELVRVISS